MNIQPARASARKSLGEWKPLIVYSNGSTEVCLKSPERQDRHTRRGVVAGNRHARGTTFPQRNEAVAAAQEVIDARRDEAIDRMRSFLASPNPEARRKGIERVADEIRIWGGNPDAVRAGVIRAPARNDEPDAATPQP